MLWHQSGINFKGEPFVQLILDEKVIGQMNPAEARDHALAMLEAAEASEQDAFILEFFRKSGMGDQAAGQFIIEFRRHREAKGKKGPPSDASEFIKPDKP